MIALASPAYPNGGGAPPGGPGGPAPDITGEAAQAFLTALRGESIAYTNAGQVITAAEDVCKLVGNGKSDPEVVNIVENNNPALKEEDATKFVAMAKRSYCPPPSAADEAASG